MDDKPRYSRVSDILQLIILMLSRVDGVSLKDIQDEFQVSRRTAERMRDSVRNILPQVDEIPQINNDRCKKWGFVDYELYELVTFTPNDIALLEQLKSICPDLSKGDLNNLITKLRAFNSKKRRNFADKIEYLLQSEGYAVRQMPSYNLDLNIVSILRQAIKEKRKISAIYNEKERILEPLGLIYGEKIHLIAREERKGKDEYNYILHKLHNVKLHQENFDDKNFSLEEFSKKSFGCYFGEVYDVKLKFIPEAADDVLHYNFHPSQRVKQKEDGSVVVSFKASGDKHIIWHLFKWGDAVEIISPAKLKTEYKNYIDKIRKNLK